MKFKEKTLDSKYVYNGKVIDVRFDNVKVSGGIKSIREVVEHSGGVVILAMVDDDHLLMVKQYRYPIQEVSLELPAGKLEYGEEPFEAAQRELEEETGYLAKYWGYLGYIYTSPGFCTEKLHMYIASDLEYVGDCPDEGEIIKADIYEIKKIFSQIRNGKIHDAKTICTLAKAYSKRLYND